MYAVTEFQKKEYNNAVLAAAQAAIDASPFKGMVRLHATDTFVEVDESDNVTHDRVELCPYELCMLDIVDRHSFKLWRRRRAYRSCWSMLVHKLSDMRVYL